MPRFVKQNSLSIFFGTIFLAALVGQAFAGWQQFNDQQTAQQLAHLSFWHYVTSADFAVDVAENWQSEFLQFWLYLTATVWLVQRGSPESKKPEETGRESDREQKVGPYADEESPASAVAGGWRTPLYSTSLALVMGLIFLGSWLVQSVAGWVSFNESRLEDMQDPIGWGSYLLNPDFWSRTLQNWQSEFLAVGSMAVLAIYLRQRGSSQSKPVGAAHSATGIDG
jgi:hypothetical protein